MKFSHLVALFLIYAGTLFAPVCAAQLDLAAAVKAGDVVGVQKLLSRGANVNATEADGTSPLLNAVYVQDTNIVQLLVNAGADVNFSSREGFTPLCLAAQTGNSAITALLLRAGARVNQTMQDGETPLMMAARTGNVETIQALLNHGALVNVRENLRGTTALMWAAAYKNAPAVRLLVANGANVSMRSGTTAPGRGPYLAPSAHSVLRYYYFGRGPNGAELKVKNAKAFGKSAEIDHAPPKALLLSHLPAELLKEFRKEKGSPAPKRMPVKKTRGGLTALHFAARVGDLASVKALVKAGANVNERSADGWTALLTATQNRYYDIGQYLLDHGADPNISNYGGWTPLYIAVDNRNIEGGDYPVRKARGMTHFDFIELLLKDGANPNLRMRSSTETRTIFTQQWIRENGATPFLRAAQSSDLKVMKLLLKYGADPNINTTDGVTPLMVASGIGWVKGVTYEWSEDANKKTIKLLLQLGNDPNAHDFVDHRTALMGAAHKGRNYAVKMLVAAGANLAAHDIGSRDSMGVHTGVTWQAIDYADGLVRVGVQSADPHPATSALIRKLMVQRGLKVPPKGRTLASICVVALCKYK